MARSRDLRVGLFVLVGMALLGTVIFLIGDERNLFSASVDFKTTFTDAQGLKPGAPVRLGGIDVGQVSKVGYDQTHPQDPTVYVTFWVKKTEKERIKTDTRAAIVNKGLLGDKMVELSLGESETPAKPNTTLESDKPADMFARIGTMADKAEAVLDNVEKATKPLADEKLHQDIRGAVAGVNHILNEVSHGKGYPAKFLSDPAEAERLSAIVKNLDGATKEAEATLRQARSVMGRVQTGPGFAHDVIYDQPQGLSEIKMAAGEVGTSLKAVRESDSLLHDVMYGGKGDGAQAIKNVAALTADLKAIIADVRAGKGTIGGLLVDPSIYEDVKVVLGNVQRNDVLRALVRYSITKDQAKPQVEVAGPR